ncbi:SHOCT domain-containing protein [Candidatus Woesearchaeota archaeon]|nr:SHOCT domain-containing protein [Candidatus Woesearchaeota archaeon]
MHKMMGLPEGSEAEEQFHTSMAKSIYCGESGGMMGSGGMMRMMNMMGGGMMGNYPLGYGYNNYGYWGMFWILLFAAVIFLVVWIVYRFGIKNTASETPLNILRKRFAKGEITKKQYDDMKKEMGE